MLYPELPEAAAGPSTTERLMRTPVSGGATQFVMEIRNVENFGCARAPASLCVVSEESQDGKKVTFTAFDPLRGRGKVLRTIQKDPTDDFSDRVSPDGSTLAISKHGEAEIHIRLLSLTGGADREIAVKSWPKLAQYGLHWSIDGRAFYVGSVSLQASTLLHADLKGNARVLWQFKGARRTYGVPSPDGRYLAILGSVYNSNVWMLEGF
jgi:hypothetical protein